MAASLLGSPWIQIAGLYNRRNFDDLLERGWAVAQRTDKALYRAKTSGRNRVVAG